MQETNVKHGTVRKCPACGAEVSAVQAKCPECGHEFSDIQANATSSKLLKALEDIDIQCTGNGDSASAVSRKIQTIKNFPIPNSKEDLIEMLTLCHANAAESGSEPELQKAWNTKTEQVISKAQIALKGDKDAQFLIEKIQGAQAQKQKKRKILISSIVTIIIVAILGGLLYKNISDKEIQEQTNVTVEYQSKITKAIQQDDVVLAYNILDSLNQEVTKQGKDEEFETIAGGSYLKIVMALLQQGELQDAARVGLEFRDKLNDSYKWHNHQIYKLLVDECEAQDIETDVLY